MATYLPPPPTGTLSALEDVDLSTEDGAVSSSLLTHDGAQWVGRIPNPIDDKRVEGPLRNTLTDFTLTNKVKGAGNDCVYDGSIWGINNGASTPLVRITPAAGGIVETLGTAGPSLGAYNNDDVEMAATPDGLYLADSSTSSNFHRATDENTITALAALPWARDSSALAAVGAYLVLTGEDAFADPAAALYDPITDTWDTSLTAPPWNPAYAKSVTIDGYVYLLGHAGIAGRKVARYNILSDTWEELGDQPSTVSAGQAACALANGLLYVFGGGSDDLHLYDPDTDTWQRPDPQPTGATGISTHRTGRGLCVGTFGNRLWMAGFGNGSGSTTVKVYG